MREEPEVELPNLFTDGLLQITPTWVPSMIKVNQLNTYNTWMPAISMAMSQPLPTGEFRWIELGDRNPKTIVEELVEKRDHGYLLEVDVAYPRELHDSQNDLPFICDRMKINGVEKLVPNLYYKKKYVVHIKALEQAINHGLLLERIHRCIEFKQSA